MDRMSSNACFTCHDFTSLTENSPQLSGRLEFGLRRHAIIFRLIYIRVTASRTAFPARLPAPGSTFAQLLTTPFGLSLMGSSSSSIPKSRLQTHARNHDANTGVRSIKTNEAERKRGFRIRNFREGISPSGRDD